MEHAILITVDDAESKEDAQRIAEQIKEMLKGTVNVTGLSVMEFDPEWGRVVIYQP